MLRSCCNIAKSYVKMHLLEKEKFFSFFDCIIPEYLTTVEMSERWNITSRRIGVLCAEGRIDGAIKKGKTWLIPSNVQKPADARFKKTGGTK